MLFEVLERKKKSDRLRHHEGASFEAVNAHAVEDRQGSDHASPETSYKRRAWAFFRPVNNRGNLMMPISPTAARSPVAAAASANDGDSASPVLRLQLFQYQLLTWTDQYQANAQWQWTKARAHIVPTVFLQYQKQARVMARSTLYVRAGVAVAAASNTGSTPRATSSGTITTENDETKAPVPEVNTEAATAIATTPADQDVPLQSSQLAPSDPLVLYARNLTEPCLLPQRPLYRLATGKSGCSSVSFSPCGQWLALAVNPGTGEFPLHLHNVSTGQRVYRYQGHRGIVYSLDWGATSQLLVSASSDGTVRAWSIADGSQRFCWHHSPSPCFVYCAVFHATFKEILVTGASDGAIRFWHTAVPVSDGGTNRQHRLRASGAAVHSIRIEPKTGRLFSGDSQGDLAIWMPKASNPVEGATQSLFPSYELIKTIRTGQSSITGMVLHPRKAHLLVQTQPNGLLQYELRSFLLLNKHYTGVACETLLIQSTFSPDGRFVASGAEDGIPHVFTSLDAQRVNCGVWGSPFFADQPLVQIAWSPSAHIAALCSYGKMHEHADVTSRIVLMPVVRLLL